MDAEKTHIIHHSDPSTKLELGRWMRGVGRSSTRPWLHATKHHGSPAVDFFWWQPSRGSGWVI